jgi:flagellar basal-body rod modification protein FlgD
MSNTIEALSKIVSPPIPEPEVAVPGTLGKEDFLRLLIAQMEKQDPLSPQDATDFTAQLAQFSSLEQLISVNQNLGGLGTLGNLSEQMLAAGAIGKIAHVMGDTISVSSSQPASVAFNLSRSSATTQLNVYDANDGRVAQLQLGELEAGDNSYRWNGLNEQGNTVPDGNYRFEIVASDATGAPIGVDTQFSGVVTGVRFDRGTPQFQIGGASYSMEDVIGLDLAG